MNSKLNELLCSYSNTPQTHFVKQPIALQCGHPICKDCLNKDITQITIQCMKCDQTVKKVNLNNLNTEFGIAKTMIKMCLSELFIEVEKRTTDTFSRFKGIMDNLNETIDAHFKFVEEEIEIRIESIKIELEKIFERFKNDLKNKKNDLKNQNQRYFETNSTKVFEDNIKKLRVYCKSKDIQSEEKFYEFQDNLKHLHEKIKQFEDDFCNFSLTFKIPHDKIKKEVVGRISFYKNVMKNYTNEGQIDLLKEGKYEKIYFNEKIREFCVLPTKFLVCVTDDSLKMYDSDFLKINEIREIDNYKIKPFGIAVNNKRNQIYVTNTFERILILDFNFNRIKFQSLYRGTRAYSIYCKNDNLLIGDKQRQLIQLYNLDVKYLDFIKLDYEPEIIRVSDTTIGVSSEKGIYFYDLKNGILKTQYEDIVGRISEENSQFYVLHNNSLSTLIYIFDTNGKLIEKIERLSKNKLTFDYTFDGQVFFFDKHLYINCYNERRLLEF